MDDSFAAEKRIRPSTIEGIFYPDEKTALSDRLHDLLNHSDLTGTVRHAPYGIIVPHAALDYSGPVAAAAYKAVAQRDLETVVLLGPVHREPQQLVLLPQSQIFQTPMGSISVQEKDLGELTGLSPYFQVDDIPHLEEHCLEAQLPFIQQLFPEARILPMLMGKPSRALVQVLTDSLWELYSGRIDSTLFVVTANMTSNTEEEKGGEEAARVIRWITRGDWAPLIDAAESKTISSCGAGCVAAILQMNDRIGGRVEVVGQSSSLAKVKDPKKVVHYAAFVLEK